MKTSKKLSLGFKFACVGVLFTACTKQIPQAYFTEINGEIASTHGNRLISGIYPHLTTYSHARTNGQYKSGEECGIGAIAV